MKTGPCYRVDESENLVLSGGRKARNKRLHTVEFYLYIIPERIRPREKQIGLLLLADRELRRDRQLLCTGILSVMMKDVLQMELRDKEQPPCFRIPSLYFPEYLAFTGPSLP